MGAPQHALRGESANRYSAVLSMEQRPKMRIEGEKQTLERVILSPMLGK